MIFIFALQLALPLLLISLTGFYPPRSAFGFCVQAACTCAALLAISLIGIWLFPPWWASWVFAGLTIVAIWIGWRRRYPFRTRLPLGWRAWLVVAAFIGIGGWGVYQSTAAVAGRAEPSGTLAELAFPLKNGTYLVVNGGNHSNVNAHLMTLDGSVARFQAYRGQSYGVDIVKLDEWGFRANGLLPSGPSQYNIYGVPVHAPCAGQVIAAIDGLPDMQVPQTDRLHMAGNHVLLRCNGADVLLGHFKPGSLKVRTGDTVAVGQAVGAVGNSGNTSEPHLHIHAQQRGTTAEPFSGNPLPMRFDGRFLVRSDRFTSP